MVTADLARRRLRQLHDCLVMAAPAVARDPSQLPTQVHGRVLAADPDWAAEIARDVNGYRRSWLRLLSRSLGAPGGALRLTLRHDDEIRAVAVSDDGRRAAAGSLDGTLRIWDLDRAVVVTELEADLGYQALALAADGAHVAFVAADADEVVVADADSGARVAAYPGDARAIRMARNGTRVAWATDEALRIRSVDRAAGDASLRQPGVFRVASSEDARFVVYAREATAYPDDLHAVTGRGDRVTIVALLDTEAGRSVVLAKDLAATCVAVADDGSVVLVGCLDGTLHAFSGRSRRRVASLEGHTDEVCDVAISADGRRAVSGSRDDTLRVWDLEWWTERAALAMPAHVATVDLSADGRTAVSGCEDGTLQAWDVESLLAGADPGPVTKAAPTTRARFGPAGSLAAVESRDGTIGVVDVAGTGEGPPVVVATGTLLDFDGRSVLAADEDAIHVVDVTAPGGPGRSVARPRDLAHAALSPRGGVVAVSMEPAIHVWAPDGSQRTIPMVDPERREELRRMADPKLGPVKVVVGPVRVGPTGSLVVAQLQGGNPALWDVESQRLQHAFERPGSVRGWDTDAELRRLVIATGTAGQGAASLDVFDVESGRHVVSHGLPGDPVGLSLSADGSVAVVLLWRAGTVAIDVGSGAVVGSFAGDAPIEEVAVSADGSCIVAIEGTGRMHRLVVDGRAGRRRGAVGTDEPSADALLVTPAATPTSAIAGPVKGERTDEMGCDHCRGWSAMVQESKPISDCADSFEEIDSYFSAELIGCPRCGTTWLKSYHENLEARSHGDFGDRTWILRPLTDDHVAQIQRARGTRALQIDTFAGSDAWFQEAERDEPPAQASEAVGATDVAGTTEPVRATEPAGAREPSAPGATEATRTFHAPAAGRVLRVFVSSTFRDMGAERDELVKRVFPQLRKLCDDRGVTWDEVDLRWGITDEQAAEGKVLPICLAEIDRSRPCFIGLLGERYGSLPDEVDPELVEREPWLGEHMDRSVTELEILHGVLRNPAMAEHAHFYFRDPAYVETLPASERAGYREASAALAARREALKDRIRRSGFPVREGYADPTALGQLVLEDFTALIERLFPEGSLPDPLDREAAEHEAFARSRAGVYVGRRAYFDRLDAHADGDGAPLAVLGPSGSGKSALLANWAIERRASHPDDVVVAHFIGGTPRSSDWAAMVRRIMGELVRRLEVDLVIPDEPDSLRLAFANLLHMAAARGRVVLVLDALDQLEDREGALDLAWLPPEIPSGVRLVVSTLPGRSLEEVRRRGWGTLEVEPLEPAERTELIEACLAQHARRLSPERVARIASTPQAANPLFVRALLEELRVFGVHEQLGERIEHYLAADTAVDLYRLILQRYEEDYERERPGLVRDAMSLIWAARRGLSEAELLDLLGTGGSPLPRAHWSPLFLAAEQALVSRSGLLGFFHDYLRQAVQHRYVPTEAQQRAAHLALAQHFGQHRDSRRAVDELPWQLGRAGAWAKLWILLGDPDFLARAWAASEWDVKALWTELGSTSPDLRMIGAYQPVVDRPHAFDEGAQRAAMMLLAHSGHREQALAIGRSLLEQSRRNGNRRLLVEAIGEVGQLLDDAAEREAAFREQEEIARSLGDPAQEAYALILQVGLLIEGGRLDDADELLDRHEDLARRSGSRAQVHLGLGNRAVIRAMRGDVDGAEQLLRDKERIAREIGDLAGVASALHNRAIVRATRGDPAGAIELFEASAGINRSLGDRETLLGTVLARGQLLLDAKRVPEAKTVLREALMLADELGASAQAERIRQLLGQAEQYVDISESVDARARTWLREHRPTEEPAPAELEGLRATRAELERALERDPRDVATLTQLGAVCLDLDEPQEAEAALRAALDLDDAFGSIEHVDARVREAARQGRSFYLPTATRRAMCHMAFACERLGRSKLAEDYILDAVFGCEDPVLLVMAGRFYLESSEPEVDTAIACFKRALASSAAVIEECDELLDAFVSAHEVLYPRSSWKTIEGYLAIWESLKRERR